MQEELFESWRQFETEVFIEDPDTVILNGDIIEGPNAKEFGFGLVTSAVAEQCDNAYNLLNRICDGRKVYGWAGSSYHGALVGNEIEEFVVHELNGQWMGFMSNVQFAPCPLMFNIFHGQGGSLVYDSRAAEAEIKEMLIAEAQGKIPHIDFLIRGHLHNRELDITIHGKRFVSLPCWKGFGDWKRMGRYYGRHTPIIGGKLFRLHETHIDVLPKIYPTPKMPDVDAVRTL